MRNRAALWAVALYALSGQVWADPEDTLNLVAGAQWMSDSNLYRLPRNEISDRVLVTTAGLHINKPYSLQRFVIDATAADYNFSENKLLNHVAKNASAAWQWAITPRLYGKLSSNYQESLNNFADYQGRQKNMRTVSGYRFDSEWDAWGRFRLLAAIDQSKLKNSLALFGESDYKTNSYELGIKYQLPSGSSLALVSRQTDGKYLNRVVSPISQIDSGFEENLLEGRGQLVFSEKTRINAKLGHLERKHDNFSSRNYQGSTGTFDFNWQPSGKVLVNAGWEQGYGAYQSFESSYYRKQLWKASTTWRIASKISLRGDYQNETRDFRGEIIAVPSLREDRLKTTTLSLEWEALRTLSVALTGSEQQRETNAQNLDFKSRMFGVNANLLF